MRSLSGIEFAAMLSERRLPILLEFAGVVKEEDSTAESIVFSPGLARSQWITIPVPLIESVEYRGLKTCGTCVHPYVTLHLKEPAPDNTEASLLAQLLSARSVGSPFPSPRLEARPQKCWRVLVYYEGQWQLNDYYNSKGTADYYADEFRRAGYQVQEDELNGPCPH